MKVKDFVNKCVDHGYEWAKDTHNSKDGYFIRCERWDTKVHLTDEAIKDNDWSSLNRGIIQGKDVYHVTRVVGYYSRVHNWNKSKLGELKDRHKGTYALK